LATVDKVFIIDFHSFLAAEEVQQTALRQLLSDLFSSIHIFKVGWAFNNADVDMIRLAANGAFRDVFVPKSNMNGFLELSNMVSDYKTFYKQGNNQKQQSSSRASKRGLGLSLSEGCDLCLGKELNKDHRMSNWDLRPLSPEQLTYAALDAHCLLGILDAVQESMNVLADERSGAGLMYLASREPTSQDTSEPGSISAALSDWKLSYVT
jgi:hypothetical protein